MSIGYPRAAAVAECVLYEQVLVVKGPENSMHDTLEYPTVRCYCFKLIKDPKVE